MRIFLDANILFSGAQSGSRMRAFLDVTGDERDFGHLFGKKVQGVKVVPPRMLADELVKLGWL